MSTTPDVLWLNVLMRTSAAIWGIIAMVGLVSGCALERSPEMLSCTTKFDCASDEVCDQGVCVPQSSSPAKREDAGSHYPRPDAAAADAGVPNADDSGQADSGQPDSNGPDSGGEVDAGEATDAGSAPDAGFDAGCATPISVDGFAGYCTIGAAVAAASNGSLINVPAGTYPESVDIAKSVTLRGSGVVVIQGPSGITPLRVRANGVSIENFTVQASQAIGVEIAGSSMLNAVIVNGAAGIGIAVSLSGTQVTISGSQINAVAPADPIWGEGIELNSGTTATIIDTTITDAAYLGILNLGASLTVGNTRIDRAGRGRCANNSMYCGYGIVTDNGTTTVQDNTVIDRSGSAGALVYQASFTMTNSTITNSGQRSNVWSPGILIDGGNGVHINNNNISSNQDEGVGCWNPPADDADTCGNNTHVNNGSWSNCPSC